VVDLAGRHPPVDIPQHIHDLRFELTAREALHFAAPQSDRRMHDRRIAAN